MFTANSEIVSIRYPPAIASVLPFIPAQIAKETRQVERIRQLLQELYFKIPKIGIFNFNNNDESIHRSEIKAVIPRTIANQFSWLPHQILWTPESIYNF